MPRRTSRIRSRKCLNKLFILPKDIKAEAGTFVRLRPFRAWGGIEMAVKTVSRNERYMLRGALKKNGFDRWRLVTAGVDAVTGEERNFFIEFYVVNPGLSPDECVFGFKSRPAVSAEDLQYALAGTQAAQTLQSERFVQPSFVMVKAGLFAHGGKHINAYYPSSQLKSGHTDFILKVGGEGRESCELTDSSTYGSVSISDAELAVHPEYLCQAGRISWNLHFEKLIGFTPDYRGKGIHWASFGARTDVEGKIVVDGREYVVTREKSFGYVDKNWGKSFTTPFFHLNASDFTSIINGKKLENSCMAVQGVYNNALSVLTSIEGRSVEFHADRHRKYSIKYECTEMPEDEDGIQLHWSVSVNDRKRVVDIDIFCNTEDMFVRDYESPEGGRRVLKVLGGGTGHGELKVYNRIKKNLDLIEYVRIANAVCEYGSLDTPEV